MKVKRKTQEHRINRLEAVVAKLFERQDAIIEFLKKTNDEEE